MPLGVAEWGPPANMPFYTRLSTAVVDELYTVAGMSAAAHGHDLYHLPLHKWPVAAVDILRREQAVIGETGCARLLEADAEASGTVVGPSTVPGAGLGLFAARDMAQGEVILPFFGQLVYHDLQVPARSTRARLSSKLYGASKLHASLATTARNWMCTALQLRAHDSLWAECASYDTTALVPTVVGSVLGLSSDVYDRPVWVVPADSCAAGRVNDPRPHLDANVEFRQEHDPVCTPVQLITHDGAFLHVLHNIKAGAELLAKYGRRYPLP